MNSPHMRVSRSDVAAIVMIAAALSCLLVPALAAKRGASRLVDCQNRLRELGVAIHNRHNTFNCFPLASTQLITSQPATGGGNQPAGYSWLAKLLPFVEQNEFFDQLQQASSKLQHPPFDPALQLRGGKWQGAPAGYSIPTFICPDSPVNSIRGPLHKADPQDRWPALASYAAVTGTHFVNEKGVGRLATSAEIERGISLEGNGTLCFPGPPPQGGKLQEKGTKIAHLTDGTSKTILATESRDTEFAAWIDGQVTWVVAAWPGNPSIPRTKVGNENAANYHGLHWPPEERTKNRISLEFGPGDASSPPYLPADRWSGAVNRRWGPSSFHAEGVNHVFGDGHVNYVSPGIDPSVYLHLVTRAGREVVADGGPGLDHRPDPEPWGTAPQQVKKVDLNREPLRLGDLLLKFPEIFELREFGIRPDNPNQAEFRSEKPSVLFETVAYDRQQDCFRLIVNEKYSAKATTQLYKQIFFQLQSVGKKELQSKPAQVVWRLQATTDQQPVDFELSLVAGAARRAPQVVIRQLGSTPSAMAPLNHSKVQGITGGTAQKPPQQDSSQQPQPLLTEATSYVDLLGSHESGEGMGPDHPINCLASEGWRIIARVYRATNIKEQGIQVDVLPRVLESDKKFMLQFKLPHSQQFKPGFYTCVYASDGAWVRLFEDNTSFHDHATGWIRVHEASYSPKGDIVEKLSLDFLSVKPSTTRPHVGNRLFGRVRYHSKIDPQPTAEELLELLYGPDLAPRYQAGYKPIDFRHYDDKARRRLTSFINRSHRVPESMEDLRANVYRGSQHGALDLPSERELWFDREQLVLYSRPLGQEPPPISVERARQRTENPQGVTCFRYDSSPQSYLFGRSGCLWQEPEVWEFVPDVDQFGSVILSLKHSAGTQVGGWEFTFRAPQGELLKPGRYEQTVYPPDKAVAKPCLWAGSTLRSYGYINSNDARPLDDRTHESATGWFEVQEIEYSPENKNIERMNVDFVIRELRPFKNNCSTFGQLRYHARSGPTATPRQVNTSLYDEIEVERMAKGYLRVGGDEFEAMIHGCRKAGNPFPKTLDQLVAEYGSDNPYYGGSPERRAFTRKTYYRIQGDRQEWYDPKLGRLYLRPAPPATAEPPTTTPPAAEDPAAKEQVPETTVEPPKVLRRSLRGEEGFTYFEVNSTPNCLVTAGKTYTIFAPGKDGEFSVVGTNSVGNSPVLRMMPPAESGLAPWGVQLAAPLEQLLGIRVYRNATSAEPNQRKPQLKFYVESSERPPATGWFHIRELETEGEFREITRISVDFLHDEGNGARALGRYRYHARRDRPYSEKQIKRLLNAK